MKIGILFGGNSNEHEISIVSATSIIEHLDKTKYEIIPIYLSKNNEFYEWHENINNIKTESIGFIPKNISKITEPFSYLQEFDLIFIMIHGILGEDGTISSILDFLGVPYIGHNSSTSVISYDKALTKTILEKHHIKTSPYINITKYNNEYIYQNKILSIKEICTMINNTFTYPLFVKPATSGSSIGITKVIQENDLITAINDAFNISNRILIEQNIVGREIECAVLEYNGNLLTSLGEIKTNNFYDYETKYLSDTSNIITEPDIDKKIATKIENLSKIIFKILNCHLYSRCDFFLTKKNEIIFNEINTIPGFTTISMYPKLINKLGISYQELLDILINEALNN